MTDLSVILVSFNTRELLRDCLKSVQACRDEVSIEAFVVDNASRDGSTDMVAADFPWVRLIANSTNTGFAAANNQALRLAQGRYLMLLNSDTVVRPGAFRELVRFMDEHPDAGYCGPRLLNGDGSHQPSARRFPTILSGAYSLTGLAEKHPDSRHAIELHTTCDNDRPFRVDWLTGACLVVRRETFDAVGPMDDGFFLYFEETDWCHRMAAKGYEGWYVPASQVVHLGGQSVRHTQESRPFSGDHPVHWVNSSRRYMRRYHGRIGQMLGQSIEVLLYTLIWMRHHWRRSDQSRQKAGSAAAAIRALLV